VIASEIERFENRFNVIVDEVRKYSPNAGTLETKAEKRFEQLDVITIVQVKPERGAVKHAGSFNLQNFIHVKLELKLRRSQAEHVKLCADLLSCSQKLPCVRKELPCFRRKLPCFAQNMSAQTQTYIDLVRAQQAPAKQSSPRSKPRKWRTLSRSSYVTNQIKPATANPR